MSTRAKTFFAGSCVFSGIIIWKVHEYQSSERTRMREGVYKDIERRVQKESEKLESAEKKLQNQQMLEQQIKLHESLSNSSNKN